MNPGYLKRLQEVFQSAAELPVAEQELFLKSACGDDAQLLSDSLSMLNEDLRQDSILDRDLAHVATQVLDQSWPLPAGTSDLGPYRLLRVLGEGGMGVVYLAERTDLHNVVAIKILRDAWLSPARHERFLNEQRTLAQLTHPSIARLYDAGVLADRTPFFAMEYVEGLPITGYCVRHNCSLAMRLELFRSVCEAVHFAHQRAVIHRDLKPSNIFVKEDGTVRLLDFGIAKQLETLNPPVEQTRTELRFLTPAYAAPEQLRGERTGVFTDVYALGVLLYELLTEILPFDVSNRTLAEAERFLGQQNAPKPSAVYRGQGRNRTGHREMQTAKIEWADLDVLCLTAMHKDLGRRYSSVEALIRDIDHYLAGQPLDAQPDSILYRLEKFTKRNRRSVFAGMALAACLAALIIFFTLRLATARDAAVAAAIRTERVERFMFNLFEGGDASAGPSEDLRVVTMIDRGVQQAQMLNREPELQADLYETLGGIYRRLGNFPQADVLLRRALDGRRALHGPNHPEVARSEIGLGLLRLDQARFAEAETLIQNGLSLIRNAAPADASTLARATAALGKVREARGDYTSAIRLLNDAVTLESRSSSLSPELAADTKELADANFYSGHYDLCDSLTERALAMHRQLFGEHHPLVADDLVNLGAVKIERGDYSQAEQFYRHALSINQTWFGPDHPETAADLYMLGEALVNQGRFTEAEPLLTRSLAVREKAYGPMHPRVANVLNELCTIDSGTNQFDKAEACFTRVVNIYRAAYSDHHYLVALGLSNLASVYLDKREYPRAEKLFREVIARFSETLSPDHLYTGISQIKLGRSLIRQHRYAEAEQHTLAGYTILRKQTRANVSWRQAARADLADIYSALHEPDKASRFRTERTDFGTDSSSPAALVSAR